MPTVDAFDAAWESVHDVEKGLMDDFREARRQKQIENTVYHSEESRANRTAYAMKLRQLIADTGGRPTREQLAAIQPDVATQVSEPETPAPVPAPSIVDEPEEMSLEEANTILGDPDDSKPPITGERRPPAPPSEPTTPIPAEIVEEQVSKPPGAITDSERLLPPPSERRTEGPVVSKPPKPPKGAVEPKPGGIVDTTKPLEDNDEAPTNESELADFEAGTKDPTHKLEPLEDEPETEEQTGFQFPTTQDKLTGHKYEGGLRSVQTSLTDSPMEALQHAEKVPLMDFQGNPLKMGDQTGWYARMGKSGRGVEVFNEAKPTKAWPVEDVMRAGSTNYAPSGTPSLPTKKIGPATVGTTKEPGDWIHPAKRQPKHMQDHSTRGMTEMRGGKRVLGEAGLKEMDKRRKAVESKTRNRKPVGIGVYYPMPGTYALDRKTGEKIASESMAVDNAWTVVKNPHANPFTDFASVLAVNEEKPPESAVPVSDPIIMKGETPLQKLREKGFDMNAGDNLTLLPSNMLLDEDMGIQDNTSLLPAGWRNE